MGWEWRNGNRYYYTAERVGGRVVKRYAGTGPAAELAAQMESRARAVEVERTRATKRERDELDALERTMKSLDEVVETVTVAAMVAAGFHRHHRGEWRKCRA